MILDCLTCHRPIAAPNGERKYTRYEVWTVCGSCGAKYLITVEQLQASPLTEAEIAARRNKTT